MGPFQFGKLFIEVSPLQVKYPIVQWMNGIFLNLFVYPPIKLFDSCHRTTHNKIVFTFDLLSAYLFTPNVFQTESRGHIIHDGNFFTNGIHEMKLCFGKKYRQRNAGKASAGTYIKNFCSGLKRSNLCYAERVKDVIDIQVIDILAGNHIDLVIPLFVELEKFPELNLLSFRKVRKVMKYQLRVIQSNLKSKIYNRPSNVIALILHHLEHQFACTVKLSFYRS